MIDPFASKTENKQEANTTTTSDAIPEVTVSGNEIGITFKKGAGYSHPWVTLKAPSVLAALEMIGIDDADQLPKSQQLKALLDRVATIGEFWTGGYDTPKASTARTQNGGKPNPPGVPEIECQHGPRNYVAKNNWAALFCSAPQGTPDEEKCEPLWKDKKTGEFKAND